MNNDKPIEWYFHVVFHLQFSQDEFLGLHNCHSFGKYRINEKFGGLKKNLETITAKLKVEQTRCIFDDNLDLLV